MTTSDLTTLSDNYMLNCVRFTVQKEQTDTVITLIKHGNYAAGELRVVKTTGEDGRVHYTFTDKDGRTVLERDSVDGGVYDTRYAYDECGNLRHVLPPAVEGNLSATVLAAYAYSYEYDNEGRCTVRKLPGADAVETVYDRADRIVMERDGNQAEAGRWTYYTYDSFGRLYSRSEVNDSRTRATLASLFGSTSYSYTPDVERLLEQRHYDDYSFLDGRSDRSAFLTLPDGTLSYSSQGGCGKGRLLGTVNYTLDTTQTAIYTVYHYDYKGNVVFQVTDNLRGGYDKVYTTYTYSGNPATVQYLHSGGSGDTAHSVCHTYSYHPMTDLVQTETVEVDGVHAYSMAYTYDDFMRLVRKTIVAEAGISTSYTYNVRDWMTGTDTDGLFTESLVYGYGGNINSRQWVQDGKTRKYTFTYDDLNRLTGAAYTGDGNYNTAYTYDRMGNITSLQRYDVSLVDNLTYTYSGNQLTKVEDATNNTAGFKNGASTSNEYTYDNNGNLTKDLNKGITNISYNVLSLPQVVTFSNGSTITYLYTADGRKLRTVHVINGTTTRTDYCGNVIYENGGQKLLLTEAGYVDLADNSHHFYIKDHLGNNRVVADANGTVEESNQYYPFGLLYANSNSNLQLYKYNGKELDTKAGLNWYDYGARHYDAALGRFTTIDPLGEKDYLNAPYNYCGNNPIVRIDRDGKIWDTIWDIGNVIYDVGAAIANHIKGDHVQAQSHWVDAGVDLVATAVPFVPAGATKVAKYADDAVDVAKSIDKVDNAKDAAKKMNTSKAARREVMREEGIPTSQQPKSQSKNESGREYIYETIDNSGKKDIKSVQQQTLDSSHMEQPHWEAGSVKKDDWGNPQQNSYGRMKLKSNKSKVYYE